MQIMNSLTEDPASKRNVIWYSGFAESPIMQRAWQSQIEPNAHSTIASAMSSIYHHDSTSKGLQPPPVGPASQQRYMPDRPLSCRPAYFEPYSAPPGLNSGFFAPGMFNVAPHLQLIPEYRHQHYSVQRASKRHTSKRHESDRERTRFVTEPHKSLTVQMRLLWRHKDQYVRDFKYTNTHSV